MLFLQHIDVRLTRHIQVTQHLTNSNIMCLIQQCTDVILTISHSGSFNIQLFSIYPELIELLCLMPY